jgi:hypothetical protein
MDNFSNISKTKSLGIFELGIGVPADTTNVLHSNVQILSFQE